MVDTRFISRVAIEPSNRSADDRQARDPAPIWTNSRLLASVLTVAREWVKHMSALWQLNSI